MKRHLHLLLLLATLLLPALTMSAADSLATRFRQAIASGLLAAPLEFHPVPTAADDYWRTLPEAMRTDYIRLGERYAGKDWTDIPQQVFAEYKTNGNRTHYEQMSFALRRQMVCLVMAEIMEHRGRFLADILKGLDYFCQEVWWGLPAHYRYAEPRRDYQEVDLFQAETAGMLAWTIYMLHDQLEELRPGICDLMHQELDRRMLTPCRTKAFGWKRNTSNWNPWICSNWLACILLCETDGDKQQEAVQQVVRSLDLFYNHAPNDGGCDEGVMYWDRAAASLIESLVLLEAACNEKVTLRDDAKLRRMGAFVYKMYIGQGQSVNFADARPQTELHPNIALLLGHYLRDSTLTGYAMDCAQRYDMFRHPSTCFLASGNYPTLGRELLCLAHYRDFGAWQPAEPQGLTAWLPDLQVCSVHADARRQPLFVAAKGGHNGESHNHNDVGNFIVYKDAQPLIIDIGVGTYTAKTFSKQRYELFNCRSAYHNVPLINGFEQHDGRNYRATGVTFSQTGRQTSFSLDMAQAYPQEAGVNRWQRTVSLHRNKEVTITEQYELKEFLQPTELVLICCGKPSLKGNGHIVIDNGRNQGSLRFDARQLSARIEQIDHQDALILNSWQQRPLYRVRLTVNSRALAGKINYRIK